MSIFRILIPVVVLSGCAGYKSVNLTDPKVNSNLPSDGKVCVELQSGGILQVQEASIDDRNLSGVVLREGERGKGTAICGKHGDIWWNESDASSHRTVTIPIDDITSVTADGPGIGGVVTAGVVVVGLAILVGSRKSGNFGDLFAP